MDETGLINVTFNNAFESACLLPTQCFSQYKKFSKSDVFTKSNEFTKSDEFSKNNVFLSSNELIESQSTEVNNFTPQTELVESIFMSTDLTKESTNSEKSIQNKDSNKLIKTVLFASIMAFELIMIVLIIVIIIFIVRHQRFQQNYNPILDNE